MKKIVLLLAIACVCLTAATQNPPKWMNKTKKAVLTVTTFDKDNRRINATTGFFITETGELLSAYSLFKGAARATVTDTEGNEYPVVSVIGADDLYDVVRLKAAVPKKAPYIPLATAPVAAGSPVYLLSYSTGKNVLFKQGEIAEVSKLNDSYRYYKLSFPLTAEQVNGPLLLPTGEVFGLAQEDASGKKEHSYAVSAGYASSLRVSTSDAFNTVYTTIGIRKAWPEEIEQASIFLFLLSNNQDVPAYLETLNDFIAAFPLEAEGYMNRASHYANNREALSAAGYSDCLALALADVNTAIKYNKNKGEAYYDRAKLVFSVAANDSTITDPNWTVEAAIAAIGKAVAEEDLPLYRQLEGDIYFYQGAYEEAFDDYMRVNDSDFSSANSYYWAAKAKERIAGAQISDIIALLDSALSKMGTPLTAEAAPYLLERIEYKVQLSLFKEAIADYDLYYNLLDGKVGDAFYYYREQAKSKAGDNEGALQDIREAARLSPDSPDYYAEEAAVLVRMQRYDEALAGIQKALALAPEFSSCYRLRGICYIRQGKKDEACEAFNRAKELNDPVVARLIKEHCR
ncbi:MAG: serine protease [Tannerellaceae bacterium]|nr:serine protease [Tannerellaceae bacterium]